MPEITKEKQYRNICLRSVKINKEERTTDLTFSSEEPVERWFGKEILSHEPGAVILDRLNSAGPFLLNHDIDQQIGVVKKSWIGDDRRGKATVRFSRSKLGEEALNDVDDEIRVNVSVAYIVHEMVLQESKDEIETYLATKWEPLEISLASIPADITVGVGRSAEEIKELKGGVKMPDPKKDDEKGIEIDLAGEREKVRKEEQSRVRDIMAISERHKLDDLGKKFIAEGKSVDDFRSAVLDELSKRGEIEKVQTTAQLGLSEKEVKEFSFMRAIVALATGKRANAPFEFEVSDAIEQKLKRSAKGFFVPMDVLEKRDLTKGSATTGGNLVGTSLLGASFIDVLRSKMVLQQMGSIMLSGLVGDIAIPSLTAGTSAYWVTENSNITTEGAPTFGQVGLSPKTVGAYVDISRKLMLQSTPSIDMLIKNDLAKSLAIELDRVGICGNSSSNEPTGITRTSGIGSVAGGTDGLAPAWSHIVGLETEVAIDNADVGNLAYLSNAKVRGKLKQTFKNATYGEIPIWENGQQPGIGMMNGYPAFVTNSVPSNLVKNSSGAVCSAIIFGNFADLIMGLWGALDINIDTTTGGIAGITRVIALQDCDIAVRHAQSFAAMLDALTA